MSDKTKNVVVTFTFLLVLVLFFCHQLMYQRHRNILYRKKKTCTVSKDNSKEVIRWQFGTRF